MPVPDFIEHPEADEYVLPPGVHQATIPEINDALVHAFGVNSTRKRIFTGWIMLRTLVRGLVPVMTEYIDGSFVTARENPADVDLSMWIRADDVNACGPTEQAILSEVFGTTRRVDVKARYRCDPYMIPHCDPGHPSHRRFVHMRDWTNQYWAAYKDNGGVVRPTVEKGFIEVVEI